MRARTTRLGKKSGDPVVKSVLDIPFGLLVELGDVVLVVVDAGANWERDADRVYDCLSLVENQDLDLHLTEILLGVA
jgi:hypothetical protein